MTANSKAGPGSNQEPAQIKTASAITNIPASTSRRKHRERMPVAPVSKYRMKQLRDVEPGTFGAALLAALGKAVQP